MNTTLKNILNQIYNGHKKSYLLPAKEKIKAGWAIIKEAIPLLTKALKMAPGNDLLMLSLAVSYAEEGNFPVSSEILRKAMKLHPKNQRIRNNYKAIRSFFKNMLYAQPAVCIIYIQVMD